MAEAQSESGAVAASTRRFALLGNPNTGKTTLFNQLCGVRAKTGNYPGVTVGARQGRCRRSSVELEIYDLPGTYGLGLDLPEAKFCREFLDHTLPRSPELDGIVVVVDASNLARNLVLAGELTGCGRPVIVALTMNDVAERHGDTVDAKGLEEHLGTPVVAINPLSGHGVDALREALASVDTTAPFHPTTGPGTELSAREAWAHDVADRVTQHTENDRDSWTDRVDRWVTQPWSGIPIFLMIMTGLFLTIFWLAETPMEGIDWIFSEVGGWVEATLPEGLLRDLLVNGVIGGVAGTVVFLPQICLLFFLLSLLEDTGYLARAAFVTDRVMRRFGLSGHAFVPLLSSHACAIPGIMSCRLIPDRNDRLAAILVAPFMSCTARLPVYVLLIGLLFADRPLEAALAFTGCYLLGALVALLTALIARRTFLRGAPRPMILELPSYKRPSLKTAAITTWDRGTTFLRKAGTVILAICVIMWWLSEFPKSEPSPQVVQMRAAAEAAATPEEQETLIAEADTLAQKEQLAGSFAGQLGHAFEPVLSPVGCDWQLSVAVLTSFLAREVFVSSMAVILEAQEEEDSMLAAIRSARRDDGSPLLSTAGAAGLLVFYVLAMQCLPTLAVTRREAGGVKWALLQLVYMTVVAWLAAVLTVQLVSRFVAS